MTINAAQLADTGFVLFVVLTCGYSLFSNRDRSAGKTRKWVEELGVLQETIRELIGDASSASSHLDRTLQKRKLELEKLLSKLDTASRAVPSPAIDDLPNESWEERPIRNISREEPQRMMSPRPAPVPPRTMPQAPKQAPIRRPASELEKRIEVFLEDKKPTRMVAEEASDPMAYKIAKRLLEQGKEIHLVAKKVGLPIEEIRVLDSMVNGTSVPAETTHVIRANEPEVMPAAPQTYSRSKQIVIQQEEPTQDLYIGDEVEENYAPLNSQIKRSTTFL